MDKVKIENEIGERFEKFTELTKLQMLKFRGSGGLIKRQEIMSAFNTSDGFNVFMKELYEIYEYGTPEYQVVKNTFDKKYTEFFSLVSTL